MVFTSACFTAYVLNNSLTKTRLITEATAAPGNPYLGIKNAFSTIFPREMISTTISYEITTAVAERIERIPVRPD